MSIRFALMLAAAGCAAPQVAPTRTAERTHTQPAEADELSLHCRAVVEKLVETLGDGASVCAEDNSVDGARHAELERSCGNTWADQDALRGMRVSLANASKHCDGLERARRFR